MYVEIIMDTGYCPSCDGSIKFASPPREGTLTVCPACKDELVVVGTSPISLDWVYEDDDDDFDD
jgi:Zn-finger nucleic acid-binding protein